MFSQRGSCLLHHVDKSRHPCYYETVNLLGSRQVLCHNIVSISPKFHMRYEAKCGQYSATRLLYSMASVWKKQSPWRS